jgi:hypothetical protein
MASAELVLIPQVDRAEARRTMTRLQRGYDRAFEQISTNAESELANGVSSGMERGADEGGRALSSRLKLAAGGIALAAGAVVMSALDAATNGADETMARFTEKLNKVQEATQTAKALGIDEAHYVGIELAGQSLGQDEGDIRGLLSGFVGSLGSDEMSNYKQLAEDNGLESAFFTFLNHANTKTQGERNILLNESFGDEDAVKAAVWADEIKKLQLSGKEVTSSNLISQIIDKEVNFERLQSGLDRSKESSKVVNNNSAKTELDKMYEGVTKEQATDMTTLENSNHAVEVAKDKTFDLRVQRAVFENTVEMKKVEVGAMGINETVGLASEAVKVYEKFKSSREESTLAVSKAMDEPSLKNTGAVVADFGRTMYGKDSAIVAPYFIKMAKHLEELVGLSKSTEPQPKNDSKDTNYED